MKIFSHFVFALHFLAVSAIIRDKFILNIYDRILRVFKKNLARDIKYRSWSARNSIRGGSIKISRENED